MQQVKFEVDEDKALVLANINGALLELPALWLRERCQDDKHLDQITKQRLYDSHQLNEEIALRGVKATEDGLLSLSFSDGYVGSYDTQVFNDDFDYSDGLPDVKSWKADTDKAQFKISHDLLSTPSGMLQALECFLTYGVLIIDGVDQREGAVLEVAERFGYVRETNFGKSFSVYTRPNSDDLAYRSVALGPHTDNPYRNPIPGIQLLHCIQNETQGGLSTLVDSLSVVSQLKQEDPEGFDLLSRVPVRYRHLDKSICLSERRTMIQLDINGQVEGIAYSPRLDFLPLLKQDDLIVFHRARKRLGQLLSDPKFEWRFKLAPGQLQMFHNSRVLHGRTEFDPNEGLRYLQGAYIDLDGPKGRYKAQKKRQLSEG